MPAAAPTAAAAHQGEQTKRAKYIKQFKRKVSFFSGRDLNRECYGEYQVVGHSVSLSWRPE